ncbi:MAG: hypothetical protein V1701_05285 [Planctomycetota bacterium]
MSRISITAEQIEYLADIGALPFKSSSNTNSETTPQIMKLHNARRNVSEANLIILIGVTVSVILTPLVMRII